MVHAIELASLATAVTPAQAGVAAVSTRKIDPPPTTPACAGMADNLRAI
jgi:hypothetical protein